MIILLAAAQHSRDAELESPFGEFESHLLLPLPPVSVSYARERIYQSRSCQLLHWYLAPLSTPPARRSGRSEALRLGGLSLRRGPLAQTQPGGHGADEVGLSGDFSGSEQGLQLRRAPRGGASRLDRLGSQKPAARSRGRCSGSPGAASALALA